MAAQLKHLKLSQANLAPLNSLGLLRMFWRIHAASKAQALLHRGSLANGNARNSLRVESLDSQ
jgi:hypothetical protein